MWKLNPPVLELDLRSNNYLVLSYPAFDPLLQHQSLNLLSSVLDGSATSAIKLCLTFRRKIESRLANRWGESNFDCLTVNMFNTLTLPGN